MNETYDNLTIEVASTQHYRSIGKHLENRLIAASHAVARAYKFSRGEISIVVVDDREIQRLNHHYLQHDWSTDVITFALNDDSVQQESLKVDPAIEGEIIISIETADRISKEQPWNGDDELLLYVIHGMLHLVGLDDQDEDGRSAMKKQERRFLMELQVEGAEHHGY